MQGMSSATCRICGGTVTNPDFREGQQTFPEKVISLESKLKIAMEALEVINHDITPWVRSDQFSEWNDAVRSVESVSRQALSQLSL